jgi:hypothetical protein
MRTLLLVSFALAAGAGCAQHDVADDGDDTGSGSGSEQPPPPREVDATGTYRIHSTFDIATPMPGVVGTVVNSVIAATDDQNDPMQWVLDEIIAQLPDGTFKDILVASEPFVAPLLNDQVHDLAPELVDTFVRIGHDVADISKHFGLEEQLAVSKPDQTYAGVMTADGFHLNVEGSAMDFPFAAYNLDNVIAPAVAIGLDGTGRFTIGEHHIPLPYGKIIRIALDAGIIPAIDPNAHDLGTLLTDLVDCQAVGQSIADALSFGSQAFWAGACTVGLQAGAQLIYDQINGIDASLLDFDVTGDSHAVDTNGDYELDKIDPGLWTGSLSYAGTSAPLATATFTGTRL